MGFMDGWESLPVSAKAAKDSRASFFRNILSNSCQAKYHSSIDGIKNMFALKGEGIKDSNSIVGEHNGYKYCISEYYMNKKKSHRWVIQGAILLKHDCPDFKILPKDKYLLKAGMGILFSIVFIVISLAFFFAIFFNTFADGNLNKTAKSETTDVNSLEKSNITQLNATLGGKQNISSANADNNKSFGIGEIIILFISLIFKLPLLILPLFFIIGSYELYKSIKILIMASKNKKLLFLNDSFREKFILETKNFNLISKYFNDQICNKILSFEPEIIELICSNNCLQYEYIDYTAYQLKDQQLNVEKARNIISDLINKALIFDEKE